MKRYFQKTEGFTLIELLVVISIIAVLASLTMPLIGFANEKAARDRARTEIVALSTALESYKIDNGDYPRSSDAPTFTNLASEQLDARKDAGMTAAKTQNPKYLAASLALYMGLSGDINRDGIGKDEDSASATTPKERLKVYYEFKPNMLLPRIAAGTVRGGTNLVTAVADPFRNPYGYSTISSKTNPIVGEGYNPTFDLWSTADKDQSKTTAEIPPADSWIKNW